jgi:hypothetical protein
LKHKPFARRSAISVAENFLVRAGLDVREEAAEDVPEATGAEDTAGHNLVTEHDADLEAAVVGVAGRRVCCS